jgi:hypothetical protein
MLDRVGQAAHSKSSASSAHNPPISPSTWRACATTTPVSPPEAAVADHRLARVAAMAQALLSPNGPVPSRWSTRLTPGYTTRITAEILGRRVARERRADTRDRAVVAPSRHELRTATLARTGLLPDAPRSVIALDRLRVLQPPARRGRPVASRAPGRQAVGRLAVPTELRRRLQLTQVLQRFSTSGTFWPICSLT